LNGIGLKQEGNPWADVWAAAAARGHTRRDAKYRVMLDWFNKWVKKAEDDKQFGRFSNLKPLGSGGFGAVFRAYDSKRKGLVAIKLPHVPGRNMPDDWDTVRTSAQQHAHFFEEARKHANITVLGCVAIYEFGMPDTFEVHQILAHLRTAPIWFSMQFVDGRSLEDVLRNTPGGYKRGETIPDDQVIDIMKGIGERLQSLHATQSPDGKGCIIHKDLKPANILLDLQNDPWLTDFGLASARFDQGVTGNRFSGTAAYAAPEQFEGAEANAQTDIWAWGIVFYELLTGQRPFGGSAAQIMDRVLVAGADAPKTLRPDIPDWLERIILKCLRRERSGEDARYRSFADVLSDLKVGPAAEAAARTSREASRFECLAANVDHGDAPESIVGRDALIGSILERIRLQGSGLMFIHANAGLGKTALMKRLRYVAAGRAGFEAVSYRFNRPLNDRDLCNCMLSLTYQVCRLSGQSIPDEFRDYADSPSQRVAYLRGQLTLAVARASSVMRARNRVLLVLVDALDEMQWDDAYGARDNALGIPNQLPDGVAYILSTRDRRFILGGAETVEIARTDLDHQRAAKEYADGRARSHVIAEFVADHSISLSELLEASQYNFMYLWFVFYDIEHNRGDYLARGQFPIGLVGYYEQHWNTLWEDRELMTRGSMKVLLCLVFSGVNYRGYQFPEASFESDQLMFVSGIEDRTALRGLLDRWDQFLDHRRIGTTTLYGFYHSSYLDFLLGQLDESRQMDRIAEAMEDLHLDPGTVFDEISTKLAEWFFWRLK
jgi:serine/threonine protein kinase